MYTQKQIERAAMEPMGYYERIHRGVEQTPSTQAPRPWNMVCLNFLWYVRYHHWDKCSFIAHQMPLYSLSSGVIGQMHIILSIVIHRFCHLFLQAPQWGCGWFWMERQIVSSEPSPLPHHPLILSIFVLFHPLHQTNIMAPAHLAFSSWVVKY